MKKIIEKPIAVLAEKVAEISTMGTCCWYCMYQPKLPKRLIEKYKK